MCCTDCSQAQLGGYCPWVLLTALCCLPCRGCNLWDWLACLYTFSNPIYLKQLFFKAMLFWGDALCARAGSRHAAGGSSDLPTWFSWSQTRMSGHSLRNPPLGFWGFLTQVTQAHPFLSAGLGLGAWGWVHTWTVATLVQYLRLWAQTWWVVARWLRRNGVLSRLRQVTDVCTKILSWWTWDHYIAVT